MSATRFELAQFNVGRMLAPLDDPVMAGFVERLEAVNAAADRAPGFVWRLQTEDGDATSIRHFDDENILVNLSVWDSLDNLRRYVYEGLHREPLRLRGSWFEPPSAPHLVLWWVPRGHRPTVEEGAERLVLLARHGPGPAAFTFKETFPPPG